MYSYETEGTYGASKTPCTVFVYPQPNGLNWYTVEGSHNVNATYEPIESGVDVETLADVDTFTASLAIDTIEALEQEVDE